MEEKKYNIGQLAELTGVSRRTIRFYVQSGLLAAPQGAGRGHFYTDVHLQMLQKIVALKEGRHSLDAIASMLQDSPRPAETFPSPTIWTRVEICAGLEIHVQGGHYPVTPARVTKLQKFVQELFGTEITNKITDIKGEAKE